MSRSKTRLLLGPALVPVLVAAFMFLGQSQPAIPGVTIKSKVIQAELNYELGKAKRPKWAQPVSSGVMDTYLQATGITAKLAAQSKARVAPVRIGSTNTMGCAHTFTGGLGGNNTRVNQDCSLRRQAEQAIAVNPTNRRNLIASQNDSRIGYNHCGFDWSFDGGVHWGDAVDPFFQFTFDDFRSGDFCSDPTVTFDSKGNAFLGGLSLSLDGVNSAVLVARSDAGINGAFYHDPDQSDPFHQYKDTPMGVVAADSDPTGCVANDKELMTADANKGSPKADNVYMVWTRFDFCTGEGVGAHSPIYFSQSTDGGFTWSAGIEISGSNTQFCTAFSGESDPNACDQDQGGQPVVGPDGTVYVAFNNGNTPTFPINQYMVVKCLPGSDCSQQSSWNGPKKISDDIAAEPFNSVFDPVTGCPAGRQCIPPNGYRIGDFAWGSISADSSGRLYFVFADGRNIGPPCDTLDYATADPPCNVDVFYSFSTDGGASWEGPFLVTANGGETAQWQPWGAVTGAGNDLWIAYYDRKYGNCEFTGCNDITLARVNQPRGSKTITYTRLTTSSMPNLVVANNPVQAGFIGDYMWVTVDSKGLPYVVWADTRSRGGTAVDEDIYFATG